MNKEEFANLLEGFDFNIIEEYWLRVKSSDNISFQLVNGFEKELDRLDQLEDKITRALKEIRKNKYFVDIGKVIEILEEGDE